ncbi:MAG: GNAT family N-acetyltransferase [Alphaproteobacteria bacterium]|nr:GNAT family N-acetyltransferase [Alphaproteobacteria bacterium]
MKTQANSTTVDHVTLSQAQTPEDIAAIRALFEEYQRFLGFDLCFQGFSEELAQLPGKYGPPDGILLLARVENALAGCIALYRMNTPAGEPKTGEIKRLYVRENYAGQGIGKALFSAVIDRARKMGYGRLRLDSLRRMTQAGKLYRQFGFSEIQPYNYNPQEDVYYMELTLGDNV